MQLAIAQQMAGLGDPFELQQRILNGSGRYVEIAVQGMTLTNEAGVPARIVGSITVLEPHPSKPTYS